MPDSTGYKRRKSNTGIEGPLESVGAWLNRLGLGAYEMTFEANRVDLEVAAQQDQAADHLGQIHRSSWTRVMTPSTDCMC